MNTLFFYISCGLTMYITFFLAASIFRYSRLAVARILGIDIGLVNHNFSGIFSSKRLNSKSIRRDTFPSSTILKRDLKDIEETKGKALLSVSTWRQLVISISGPIGIVLACSLLFTIITTTVGYPTLRPVVDHVTSAYQEHLAPGDIIIAVNGTSVDDIVVYNSLLNSIGE